MKVASPHTRGWTLDVDQVAGEAQGFPAHAGMDPSVPTGDRSPPRLPRTRGDGPFSYFGIRTASQASPHTRGWTLAQDEWQRGAPGFPAHAGMDPIAIRPASSGARLPRTRGDGPVQRDSLTPLEEASPHTRGWTRPAGRDGQTPGGFPAHAGMDPAARAAARRWRRLPRTRGDGPRRITAVLLRGTASPHTRGWTPGSHLHLRLALGFPAHAGMDPIADPRRFGCAWLPRTRGDGPGTADRRGDPGRASPHTRGWTPACRCRARQRGGFPAHAGMDPHLPDGGDHPGRLPRTRGDGPDTPLPRASRRSASPHTRGWTRRPAPDPGHRPGFPAHAGMDPPRSRARRPPTGLPRTRGDGPWMTWRFAMVSSASPHTRGWTRPSGRHRHLRRGFPAHAGMDPAAGRDAPGYRGLPRTRGDGPDSMRPRTVRGGASPHTRGWTVDQPSAPGVDTGFPAHAGMDPQPPTL